MTEQKTNSSNWCCYCERFSRKPLRFARNQQAALSEGSRSRSDNYRRIICIERRSFFFGDGARTVAVLQARAKKVRESFFSAHLFRYILFQNHHILLVCIFLYSLLYFLLPPFTSLICLKTRRLLQNTICQLWVFDPEFFPHSLLPKFQNWNYGLDDCTDEE